jgi:hypothetical protein
MKWRAVNFHNSIDTSTYHVTHIHASFLHFFTKCWSEGVWNKEARK